MRIPEIFENYLQRLLEAIPGIFIIANEFFFVAEIMI